MDLENAYKQVCWEELWETLQRYGESHDVLRAINQTSEACASVRKVWGKAGSETGLSYTARAFSHHPTYGCQRAEASFQGGVRVNTCQVHFLLFADDTGLVKEAGYDLKHNFTALQEAVREHTVAVNWCIIKTKEAICLHKQTHWSHKGRTQSTY